MAAREERTLQITGRFRDEMSQSLSRVRTQVRQVQQAFSTFGRAITTPIRVPLQAIDSLTSKLLNVRNVIAGFALVQVARSAFGAFGEVAEDLDKIAKTAGRLQATTESVSSLAFVARSAGTNLEEIRPGLQQFSVSVEAARLATGAQRDALRALGIEIDSVRDGKLDLIDILARSADGFARLDSATERVAVSTVLFGEAGASLAPLLQQGAAAVRDLDRVARESGVVFSAEQLARVEAYNDALLKVQTAFRGAFGQFFVEIAPQLAGFFERLGQLVRENRQQITDFLVGLSRGVADFVRGAIRGIFTLAEALESVVRRFSDIDGQIEGRIAELQERQVQFAPTQTRGGTPRAPTAEQQAQLEAITLEIEKLRRAQREGFTSSLRADFEAFLADVEAAAAQIAIPVPATAAASGSAAGRQFAAAFDAAVASGGSVGDQNAGRAAQRSSLEAERSILALQAPTRAVSEELIRIDTSLRQLDFRAAFETGQITVDQFAAATRAASNAAVEGVAQLGRTAEAQSLRFERSLLDLEQPSREVAVAINRIQAELLELDFEDAFARGEITADQLAEALERVRAATERSSDRIRGDFAGSFEDAARRSLEAFTDVSAFAEDAANQLVGGSLDRFGSAIGDVITGAKSAKDAFRDFGLETLRIVGQLIGRFIALQLVTRLIPGFGGGIQFAEGGIMPGRMGPPSTVKRYEFGGIARSPQVAVFGEGRQAEAFVPLPDGRRIPVQMRGGGGDGLTIVVQTVDSRDTARWFLENRGTILGITRNGLQTSFGQRQAVQGAVR